MKTNMNAVIDLSNVDAVCNAVMVGVANQIRGRTTDYKGACEVMRAEVKALIFGDEYQAEREAILNHSVSSQTVLALVIANCVGKILGV